MSEFEDKLNKILSSPGDMEKIMGIAKSLSGAGESKAEEGDVPGGGGLDMMSSMLGNLDPKIIRLISRMAGEYSSKGSDKTALISAIKPYLKEDRREKMDKAAEIAKLAYLAKIAFSEFSGGGGDV